MVDEENFKEEIGDFMNYFYVLVPFKLNLIFEPKRIDIQIWLNELKKNQDDIFIRRCE